MMLRPATIDDLALLQYWDQQEHVIASDPDDDWDWEKELTYDPMWRDQLVAELDGRPIGFLQIIDPALEVTHYWGMIDRGFRAIDIWIGEAADLNQGYGTRMMHLAIQRCFAEVEVKAILIDPLVSNTKAHRFYKRLGFQFVEARMFYTSHCYVFRLDRENYQAPQKK